MIIRATRPEPDRRVRAREKIRDISTHLLYLTGLTSLARHLLARRARFVLIFHGISSRKHASLPDHVQPYISKDDLRAVLAWLGARFSFLTPLEFLETGNPAVLLTFDDGLANNFTNVLPVLEEFAAPAIFFVSSQHITDPRDWLPATRAMARSGWGSEDAVPEQIAADFYHGMSVEQLAACATHPLITIASHTVTHPFLTQCDPDQLAFELSQSKQTLESITNQPVDLFAYPSGDYNRTVAAAVRDAGYRAAFAVEPKNVGLPAYEIPRIGIYQPHPPYLSLKLSGLHCPPISGKNPTPDIQNQTNQQTTRNS